MTRPLAGASGAPRALAMLLAAASWGLLGGCALFTDLSSDPYHAAEAGPGEGGACTGDAGCPALSIACLSAANCQTGQTCCLTPSSLSSATAACVAPSACSSQSHLSFQLCTSTGECESGDSCSAQECTFGGTALMIRACQAIPTCSPL